MIVYIVGFKIVVKPGPDPENIAPKAQIMAPKEPKKVTKDSNGVKLERKDSAVWQIRKKSTVSNSV